MTLEKLQNRNNIHPKPKEVFQLLSFQEVTVQSSSRMLLHKVSLTIRPGEWYALVGQSGSGKSLLSQAAGQLLPPTLHAEGKILLDDQELLSMSLKSLQHIRGRRLAYIFQDYQGSFTPFRTIGQHFMEYIRTHDKVTTTECRRRTEEALASVGLEADMAQRYPFQLSGGQLQRISIALALLFSPDVLIADEVTTALDSMTGHRILELLRQRQQVTGCAILFITHDWRLVRRYADRIAVMLDGTIVESGRREQMLSHPRHEYTKQLIAAAPMLGAPVVPVPEAQEVAR